MDQTMPNGITPKAGWSWGGFMFHFYFLIAVKKYQLLWWYLLALVPFLNVIFLLASSIYLGTKGHEIGATGTQFANQSEYDGYMKGTDHAGKIGFFITIGIAVIAIIVLIVAIAFGLHAPHTDTAPTMMPAPGLSTY